MADATIDSELFVLRAGRFGTSFDNSVPPGGFTGSTHHNVATAVYNIGQTKLVYNDGTYGQPGYSEFVYLLIELSSAPTMAAKQVCVPDSATVWYTFTNDPDGCLVIGGDALAVIGISAMTDGRYGWFWSGGICPEEYVTALGGDYATADSVVEGPITAVNLTADAIGLGNCGGDTEAIIGYALTADS